MSPDDPPLAASLTVAVTDANGPRLRKRALARWLQAIAPARARGTVTLALVGDAAMRRLNRQYARHDYATDVLSFPGSAVSLSPAPRERQRVEGPSAFRPTPHLGDIVIATGVAAHQARTFGHPLEIELRVLALHGLLHLLGYDHTTDRGEMSRAERRLRRKGGLHEGLIDRAVRSPKFRLRSPSNGATYREARRRRKAKAADVRSRTTNASRGTANLRHRTSDIGPRTLERGAK